MATAASPSTDGGATVAEKDGCLSLPTDAFVEILLRLPPSCRLWARLVCRHWRDVIDACTPRIPPPKVLAFFTSDKSVSAYVVNDLEHGWGREVWGVSVKGMRRIRVAVVSTCNGLLCLCDEDKPGGAISLLNPATGEALRVPPLPALCQGRGYGSGDAYTFGFVPATGKYKLLHLPCRGDRRAGWFSVLQAFTLGDTAWREVACPGASCHLNAGVVSVGAAAYWITNGTERVVSFDLGDDAGRRLQSDVVRSLRIAEAGTAVASKEAYNLQTFAYVETTEPLSVYKVDNRRIKGGSIRK